MMQFETIINPEISTDITWDRYEMSYYKAILRSDGSRHAYIRQKLAYWLSCTH